MKRFFSLPAAGKSRSEDRSRRAVSDGNINLTFLKYDSEESPMAKAISRGHAFGFISLLKWTIWRSMSLRHANLAVRSSAIPPRRR